VRQSSKTGPRIKSWTIENKFDEAGSTSWLIGKLMTFVIDPQVVKNGWQVVPPISVEIVWNRYFENISISANHSTGYLVIPGIPLIDLEHTKTPISGRFL
jgi:hypothetical protein